MNHYSNLAAMIIRLLGVLMLLIGLMGIAYWILSGTFLGTKSPEYALHSARILSAVIFMVVGAIIYLLGKPIGKIVGRGIGE